MTKRQIIEEPCEGKLSSTDLKTSGTGDSLAEFNRRLSFQKERGLTPECKTHYVFALFRAWLR